MDDEERSKLQVMLEQAPRLEPDLEDRLLELQRAQEGKFVPQHVKEHYEHLRDQVAPELLARGPRYYIGADGEKMLAYTVQPETIDISLAKLRSARDDGLISDEVYESVVTQVVDREAFARAVRAHRISPRVFARVARRVPKTAYVRFVPQSTLDEAEQ